jgi:putative ABC transport system ATP-binding protein
MPNGTSEQPVIVLDGVARTYPGPPPIPALLPTSLRVGRGDHVAIVGPSGAGKSTLLNVLGLLDRPTSGHYLFDGIDVGSLGDAELTALRGRRIGFVFQAFHLIPYRTALENVALAQVYARTKRADRIAEARAALAEVGLDHRVHALPTTLSGGEQQRVAIARAIMGNPSLLLCDEPTGNLDSETALAILDVLDRLHGAGIAIVVITHDSAVAGRAGRTVTIRDGCLTEAVADHA